MSQKIIISRISLSRFADNPEQKLSIKLKKEGGRLFVDPKDMSTDWTVGAKLFWDIEIKTVQGVVLKTYRQKRFSTYTDLYNFIASLSGNDNDWVHLIAYFISTDSIEPITKITGQSTLYHSFFGRKSTRTYNYTVESARQLSLTNRDSADFVTLAQLAWKAYYGTASTPSSDDEYTRVTWKNAEQKAWKISRPLGRYVGKFTQSEPDGLNGTSRIFWDVTTNSVVAPTSNEKVYLDAKEMALITSENGFDLSYVPKGQREQIYKKAIDTKMTLLVQGVYLESNVNAKAIWIKPGFGIDAVATNSFDDNKYDLMFIVKTTGSGKEIDVVFYSGVMGQDAKHSNWIFVNEIFSKFFTHNRGARSWRRQPRGAVTIEITPYLIAKNGGYISAPSPYRIVEKTYFTYRLKEIERIY